jgi:hypothetical protein
MFASTIAQPVECGLLLPILLIASQVWLFSTCACINMHDALFRLTAFGTFLIVFSLSRTDGKLMAFLSPTVDLDCPVYGGLGACSRHAEAWPRWPTPISPSVSSRQHGVNWIGIIFCVRLYYGLFAFVPAGWSSCAYNWSSSRPRPGNLPCISGSRCIRCARVAGHFTG